MTQAGDLRAAVRRRSGAGAANADAERRCGGFLRFAKALDLLFDVLPEVELHPPDFKRLQYVREPRQAPGRGRQSEQPNRRRVYVRSEKIARCQPQARCV